MDPGTVRLIIVEDSTIVRARFVEALAEIPQVDVIAQVDSEAAALAVLRQGNWDAAILDLQLKQGTGLGILKSLASEGRPANAVVIVCTNYSFPQYRDRSRALGADHFFDKAREFDRVLDVIRRMHGDAPSATC